MNSKMTWKTSRQFTEISDYVNLGSTRGPPSSHSKPTHQPLIRASENSSSATTQNTPYSRPVGPNKPKMPVQLFFAPTSSFLTDESQTPAVTAGPSKKPFEPDLNASRFTTEEPKIRGNPQHDPEPFQLIDKAAKKPRRLPIKPEPQDFKRILIGSVEQVIRWHKIAREAKLLFLFEAVGILDNWSIKGSAQLLFLRGDLGQIIQGLFYSIDHGLPPLKSGSIYSVVGKMIGSHKMIVFDANEIQQEEKAVVQRLAFLSQRQLNSAAGKVA